MDREQVRDMSPFAQRAFAALVREWQLTAEEGSALLGGGNLKPDQIDGTTFLRLSLALGIYNALHGLLDPAEANSWIHLPNPAPGFDGRTPLERMASVPLSELEAVRRHLDCMVADS